MLGTVTHSAPNLPILAAVSAPLSGSMATMNNNNNNSQQHGTGSVCVQSHSPITLPMSSVGGGSGGGEAQLVANAAAVVASQTRQFMNNSNLKLMQRLLDEASQTGELVLNGRNLTEFPSKLALVYDLSDTIFAGMLSDSSFLLFLLLLFF